MDLKEIKLTMDREVASEEDVKKLFELALKAMKEVKGQLNDQIKSHKGETTNNHSQVLNDIKELENSIQILNKNLSSSEAKLSKDMDKAVTQIFSEMKRIEASIPMMPDMTPLDVKIAEVEAKIPKIEEVQAESIKEKLESLEGDERLDASAIKNLPKAKGGITGHGHAIAGQNIAVSGATVSLSIPIQSSAPINPQLNDLWIDSS